MRPEQFWESAFTPFRRRIVHPIAAVASAIFLPLAVHDLITGRAMIGAVLMVVMAMLVTNALALRRRAKPPIPFAALMVPAFAGVGLSLASDGVQGVLWTYPVIFLSFFVLPRRSANLIAIALAGTATLLFAMSQEPGTTIRYALSMALCLVVINIMLGVLTTLHERLLEQSITDALTGAYNRRHMDESLDEAIERRSRKGTTASAMLIDLDHFKAINDRFGHDAGDDALKGVVAAVRERCRKLDMLFRQGGEEFLLLLPDTRIPEALGVAESLRAAIERAPVIPGGRVTVSIGVDELRAGDDARSWMRRIDRALYRAKDGGRNRVAAPTASERHLRPVPKPRLASEA